MAKPLRRRRKSGQDSEDEAPFGPSLVRDNLSRISEGSNEAPSVTSSAYYSLQSSVSGLSPPVVRVTARGGGGGGGADTAAATAQQQGSAGLPSRPVDRAFHTSAGPLRLPPGQSRSTRAAAAPSTSSCGSQSLATPQGNVEALRQTVKAFVESGVRGRIIEALRQNGQTQLICFRLSRDVDAFEIAPEGAAASHTVRLLEVASVYTGAAALAQGGDFVSSLPGLDGRCAVVDLKDGRCLTFRFPEGQEEAETFAACMQIFANEVQREAAPPR